MQLPANAPNEVFVAVDFDDAYFNRTEAKLDDALADFNGQKKTVVVYRPHRIIEAALTPNITVQHILQ